MSRFLFATLGSLGDLYPNIAVAHALVGCAARLLRLHPLGELQILTPRAALDELGGSAERN